MYYLKIFKVKKRRLIFLLLAFAFINNSISQTKNSKSINDDKWIAFAQRHQDSLSEVYSNPETSILSKRQLKKFKGLEFYPINLKFRVSANFKRTPDAVPFEMAVSSGNTREYVSYGIAIFEIDGVAYNLPIYQNTFYIKNPDHEYGKSLFLAFTDYTSGDGSYGGGRYIDIDQSDIIDNTLIIDFNKSYNPYCAYTAGYSCPIPPEANDLKLRIEVGVKDFGKH